MEEEIIGKIIRDTQTGDIGKILQLNRYNYYLIRWAYTEKDSHHFKKGKDEHYSMYTEKNLRESGRFQFLTEQEAFFWVL